MLSIQELIPLGPKTTMRIGGQARFYAELKTKKDCEEAYAFARSKKCLLIVLGAGSNTIFADGTIEALVVRIMAEKVVMQKTPHPSPLPKGEGTIVHVEAGKNLAQFINELAEQNLDLSPLTGIPGTIGGAVFGNAGQGYGGIWIGNFVKEVEVFIDGAWQTFARDTCRFRYRESHFKDLLQTTNYSSVAARPRRDGLLTTPLIWSVVLEVPSRPKAEIQAEIQRLLKHRIETQPHVKTAGSCFLSISQDLPAWKLIDEAGLRGKKVGGVAISEKHANFLIADKGATFADAKSLIEAVQKKVPQPLHVEMRLIGEDGRVML